MFGWFLLFLAFMNNAAVNIHEELMFLNKHLTWCGCSIACVRPGAVSSGELLLPQCPVPRSASLMNAALASAQRIPGLWKWVVAQWKWCVRMNYVVCVCRLEWTEGGDEREMVGRIRWLRIFPESRSDLTPQLGPWPCWSGVEESEEQNFIKESFQ